MTNTENPARLIDEMFTRPSQQSYKLVQLYRIGGELLQVTVDRDSYRDQCWAAARILNSARGWTVLLSADRSDVDSLPSPYAAFGDAPKKEAARSLAVDLLARAERVLAL